MDESKEVFTRLSRNSHYEGQLETTRGGEVTICSKETSCLRVNWIELILHKLQWRAFVVAVMNLCVLGGGDI